MPSSISSRAASTARNTEFRWEGQGWVGTDYDKLWIKSEGTLKATARSKTASTSFSTAAPSRPISICRAGCAAISIHGPPAIGRPSAFRAWRPYFFDLEVTGYVSGRGPSRRQARGLLRPSDHQRLILQPQIELNFYSKADPRAWSAPGFPTSIPGLRLRYEFTRKFAPYIGVVYEGKFGQTASFARRAGESTSDVRFVFGIRIWF